MYCKKCNAELVEDAIYCPQCGARVDGKKECFKCGKSVAENSVFCTYCGTRLDGKKECPECGTAFDGDFCPHCGKKAELSKTGVSEISETTKTDTRCSEVRKKVFSVLKITKQSFLYAAVCILFICSFFISLSVVQTEGGEVVMREESGATSFYFLIKFFIELKDFFAQAGTLGVDYYQEFKIALYLQAALCCAVVAVIIIFCTVYFTCGTVAFVNSLRNKKEVAMSKYVITPAVVSLGLHILLKSLWGVSAGTSGASIIIKPGIVSVLNIVFVSVLLAGAAFLHIITNAKHEKKNIVRYVISGLGAIFAFILLLTVAGKLINIKSFGIGSALQNWNGSMSAPLFMIGIMGAIGLLHSNALTPQVISVMNQSIIIFVFYILIFILSIIILYMFSQGITDNKSSLKRILAIVLSCFVFVLSVTYLILTIILLGDIQVASIGASSICAIIFSLFVLGLSVASAILLKKKGRYEEIDGGKMQAEP